MPSTTVNTMANEPADDGLPGRQRRLAVVVRHVSRAAEQNREPIAQRIRRELLIGDCAVLLCPVGCGEVIEPCQEPAVHIVPETVELRC